AANAMQGEDETKFLRFDPEGVRLLADGSLVISDEYGPWIDEFSPAGVRKRRFATPQKFRTPHPSADAAQESPPVSLSGRQPNRGLEGLAIAPDHKHVYAMLQSPLIQDGALNEKGKRIGVNIRMLELNLETRTTRELVYVLENASNGANEIEAVSDHEFLVLERDGKDGNKAQFRRVYRVDIAGATDVSDIATLPTTTLPETIKPVRKTMFLDFMDDAYGLRGPAMPEKIEGLALGPKLQDGRRVLVATVDNDFNPNVPNIAWVFSVKLD
ncbi:MAG TPA: esterase-like activity of phytase family protein, partial [Phycisphaerales bacterium]|nr:esterase-like activity of phytase family protein [Phycisphaerales bacterium]